MKDEDRAVVFRGNLSECLRHLGNSLDKLDPKGPRGSAAKKKKMAKFCQANERTVADWLRERVPLPKGMKRIRLVCFLQIQGYEIQEVEKLEPARRGFLEILGYGLMTENQAKEAFGTENTSRLYEIAWATTGLSKERELIVWELWKNKKTELAQVKQQKEAKFHLRLKYRQPKLELVTKKDKVQAKPAAEQPAAPTPSKMLMPEADGDIQLEALVKVMEANLGLLDLHQIDQLSPSQLKLLNGRAAKTVARLAASLGKLSSELLIFSQQRE